MFIKKKKGKGQSTVEYIVLVAAVILVLVSFIYGKNSLFGQRINKTYDSATGAMTGMGERAVNVFKSSPPG